MEYVVKTRFNIGDEVWVMKDNLPTKMVIYKIVFWDCVYTRVPINESTIEYGISKEHGGFNYVMVGGYKRMESDCFSTKEEMIEKFFKEETK